MVPEGVGEVDPNANARPALAKAIGVMIGHPSLGGPTLECSGLKRAVGLTARTAQSLSGHKPA